MKDEELKRRRAAADDLSRRRKKAFAMGVAGMAAGGALGHRLARHIPTIGQVNGKTRLVKPLFARNRTRSSLGMMIGAGLGMAATPGATKHEGQRHRQVGAQLAAGAAGAGVAKHIGDNWAASALHAGRPNAARRRIRANPLIIGAGMLGSGALAHHLLKPDLDKKRKK